MINSFEQVDFRIMSWCWLMFLALDLNRRNINRGTFSTICIGDFRTVLGEIFRRDAPYPALDSSWTMHGHSFNNPYLLLPS